MNKTKEPRAVKLRNIFLAIALSSLLFLSILGAYLYVNVNEEMNETENVCNEDYSECFGNMYFKENQSIEFVLILFESSIYKHITNQHINHTEINEDTLKVILDETCSEGQNNSVRLEATFKNNTDKVFLHSYRYLRCP